MLQHRLSVSAGICGSGSSFAIAIPIYRSLHSPLTPKSPKSLKKVFPGLPAQSVKKVSKKSLNTHFRVLLDSFSGPLGLFRHFFGTPGREAREDLFETFWGFWGQRASGLLYMAVPIAIPVPENWFQRFRVCFQFFRNPPLVARNGQRTEQVKTGQVNPDRPFVGPSVGTFVGCFVGAFVGSPPRAEIGKSTLVGALVGALVGGLVGPLVDPLVGPLVAGPLFAFACSVRRPRKGKVLASDAIWLFLPVLNASNPHERGYEAVPDRTDMKTKI